MSRRDSIQVNITPRSFIKEQEKMEPADFPPQFAGVIIVYRHKTTVENHFRLVVLPYTGQRNGVIETCLGVPRPGFIADREVSRRSRKILRIQAVSARTVVQFKIFRVVRQCLQH